jgi:hypothetical protein
MDYESSGVPVEDQKRKYQELKDMYSSWEGYPVVCLPNKGADEIVLEGFEISTQSKALIFEIKQCSNETLNEGDLPCHNQTEIDAYTQDIQVETWANYDKVAIEKHDMAPLDRYDNWLFTSLLETKYNKRNFIMLRKNEIETEDSFLPTDDVTFEHTMYAYSKHQNTILFSKQNEQIMLFQNIFQVQ